MAPPLDVRFPPLLAATFVDRPHRFMVRANQGGTTVDAACLDPGRLRKLLVPGAEVRLARAEGPHRRTAYTLVLVRQGRTWVSAWPALANAILQRALARGVTGLTRTRVMSREVRAGESRIDFLLAGRGRHVLTEVKSVTLVEHGVALFPDAPTARGTRHLRELIAARRRGEPAMVVFVVQRPDARHVSPHRAIDPSFALALEDAARAGVRLRAYTCRVTTLGVTLDRPIPVHLKLPTSS
jgi:sugar fermentation stimulation protein A